MAASLVGGKRFGSGIFFLFVNDLYLKLKEIIFGTILILAMLKRTCHRILCHIGIEAIKKMLVSNGNVLDLPFFVDIITVFH